MKATVVFDNYLHSPALKTEWGFSCMIQGLEKTILFDTGSDGTLLLSNMKILDLDVTQIDTVMISHDHWDHTGGLNELLNTHQNVDVYVLPSFSGTLKKGIEATHAHLKEDKSPTELCSHAYSTGMLGTTIKEQSLVIKTSHGLIVITGCAHPGVVHIIETAKNYFKQNIFMVFGGFHLGGYADSHLLHVIKDFRGLGVEKAGPCHCSGDRCRELFKEEYKDDFMTIGAGTVIEINSVP
jgi:7,8-dihydropterin-6-yl-methyl-4-(beta-D-ribofuranosyl)aminobenzene 5'-phosphate synthase